MRKIAAIIAVMVVTLTIANAGTIVQWHFTSDLLPGGANAYGPNLFKPRTVVDGITVRGLYRRPEIKTDHTIALGNAWGGVEFTASSWETALGANQYFCFMLTADPGMSMSITGFEMILRSTTTGPTEALWLASYNGFTSYFKVGDVFALENGANAYSLDFASANLTIEDITQIEFRLVVWGGQPNGVFQFGNGARTAGAAAANNFTVLGTIGISAIPEPSTALLAMSGVAMLVYRRKRQAR